MSEEKLGLFYGEDKPDVKAAWDFYTRGLAFNNQIELDDTVKVNSNFVVGKQWEGVQANGLPTPQFNILKRVVGFIVASITTDNIKVNASPLSNSTGTNELVDVVRILNEELDALNEHNKIPALARGFAYDSAVCGDGCMLSLPSSLMKTSAVIRTTFSRTLSQAVTSLRRSARKASMPLWPLCPRTMTTTT